jgi:hypothetical protein
MTEQNRDSGRENSDITLEVIEVLLRIPKMDEGYLKEVIDEIQKLQPFVFVHFMKYSLKFTDPQADEFLKLLMIVWDFYKTFTKVSVVEIKERDFMDYQDRNKEMLSHMKKRNHETFAIDEVMKFGLINDHSKSLMSIILLTVYSQMNLGLVHKDEKHQLLIAFKTLIQCFDRNINA